MEERRKITLELLATGDGRTFLNFWNWMNGDDVTAELRNGKLFTSGYDINEEKEMPEKEISLQEFIDTVKSKF